MTQETTASEKPLVFAKSESKPVGMFGSMMDELRDNSPRIVGAMKMAGDLTAAVTLNPFLMTFAAFSLTGRVFVMLWGTKANQAKVASEHKGETVAANDSVVGNVKKILTPRQHPVEAGAGLSMVGETFQVVFGATELAAGRGGISALLAGMLAVWSYGNILFTKEAKKGEKDEKQSGEAQPEAKDGKEGDPLVFAKSESKPVGFIGRVKSMIKNNPVLVSSLLNIAVCLALFAGSLGEGMSPVYVAYAAIGVASNLVQALLVRKNEFNIEGAQQKQEATAPAAAPPEQPDPKVEGALLQLSHRNPPALPA